MTLICLHINLLLNGRSYYFNQSSTAQGSTFTFSRELRTEIGMLNLVSKEMMRLVFKGYVLTFKSGLSKIHGYPPEWILLGSSIAFNWALILGQLECNLTLK